MPKQKLRIECSDCGDEYTPLNYTRHLNTPFCRAVGLERDLTLEGFVQYRNWTGFLKLAAQCGFHWRYEYTGRVNGPDVAGGSYADCKAEKRLWLRQATAVALDISSGLPQSKRIKAIKLFMAKPDLLYALQFHRNLAETRSRDIWKLVEELSGEK